MWQRWDTNLGLRTKLSVCNLTQPSRTVFIATCIFSRAGGELTLDSQRSPQSPQKLKISLHHMITCVGKKTNKTEKAHWTSRPFTKTLNFCTPGEVKTPQLQLHFKILSASQDFHSWIISSNPCHRVSYTINCNTVSVYIQF